MKRSFIWLFVLAFFIGSFSLAHSKPGKGRIKPPPVVQPEPPPPATQPPADSSVAVPLPIQGLGYYLAQNWDFGVNIKTQEEMYAKFFTRFIWGGGTTDTLSGNGEWQRFRDNDNHRLLADRLQLVAHVRNGLNSTGGIESGMLRSKATFQYGYLEARMKVPAGPGLWTAFWTVAEATIWPPEIDVVEILTNANGNDTTYRSYHFLHGGNPVEVFSLLNQWGSYGPGFDYKDDFHVFAVLWTPDSVKHFVDGKLVVERTFTWRHDNGTDAGPAHVLMTLSVGGNWPGAPTSTSYFPATLDVDYIRVWQK